MATPVDTSKVYASFAVTKSYEDDNGNLIVVGKATDGSVDSDRQIIDPGWSAKALTEWMNSGANVRVQHQARRDPAGKGIGLELDRDGDGGHWLKALVVEPVAKELVKHGVLRAFSVGISNPIIDRDMTGKAAGGIIKGGELFEVSLVDRPANKSCGFTLAKSAGDGGDDEWDDVGDFDALLFEAKSAELAKAEYGAGPDSSDDTDGDGDEDEDDKKDDDKDDKDEESEKAYVARHTLWKSAEPHLAKGADATEYLQARAAYQKWQTEGEQWGLSEGLFRTRDGRALFKRKFDPDVGGGVDRDKIPAADFAGKDRSFPIVTPGDVSDAASSLGRAGADNYSTDQIKANIIRIARRKGGAFVDALPEAWKDGDASKAMKPKKGKKAPFEGAAEPFDGKDTDGDGQDADKPTAKKAAAVVKQGARTCPKCGKVYHADSKVKACTECGTKLPKAKAMKTLKIDISGAEALDADTLAKVISEQLAKKKKRPLPADVKPVAPHREPDGPYVEALEHDAGLPTDPDPEKDKVPASVGKAEEPTYSVKRMHDAFCAAYHTDAVFAEYPSLKSVADAADERYWTAKMVEAAASGDTAKSANVAVALHAVQLLKAADPVTVADARALLHKTFADMYPNMTSMPTPVDMTPGKFQRPYMGTGRAPLAATGTSPHVPPGTHTPEPEDFQRGLITAGHQAKPPAAKALNSGNNPYSYDARAMYGPAAREAAANYMKSIHDRLTLSMPDLCPMAESASVMPPDLHAGTPPHAVTPPATHKAPGEKAYDGGEVVTLLKALIKQGEKRTKKSSKVMTRELVKAQEEINVLRKQIDELGSQPDPSEAPQRGVLRKSASPEETVAPVERRNLLDEAQQHIREQHEQELAYAMRLMKSGDPSLRQRGETWMEKLLTTPEAE